MIYNKKSYLLQVEASCHELTRLSGLLRQHSRKRKFEQQNPEESGPEWKRKSSKDEDEFREGERKSSNGRSPKDEDDDFREGDPASPEKMARINVREYTLRDRTFLKHGIAMINDQ